MHPSNGRTSDFTTVAGRYDATRHVPSGVLARAYEMLMDRSILPRGGTVLDAGCGTGQMSIPLVRQGFEVVGIDVSDAMVRIATSKIQNVQQARYEVGDVRSLPYGDGTFDSTVFSKLLMHVEDWKAACRELVRVTKAGSCIVQIIDRGFFGNAVRREFARRADELGFTSRFLGAASWSGEIPQYMASLNCDVISIESEILCWNHCITPRDALEGFHERLFAEFWYMPGEVYDRLLAQTGAWAAERPGGIDEPEHLKASLTIEVYRTPLISER